jgi:hypothetical protein
MRGWLNFSLNLSRGALLSKIFVTILYYNNISLPGRNAGIYTKEASVSAANLLLSQGDRHPASPIISFHHLSRPQITFAIFFPIEVSLRIDGRPPALARLN